MQHVRSSNQFYPRMDAIPVPLETPRNFCLGIPDFESASIAKLFKLSCFSAAMLIQTPGAEFEISGTFKWNGYIIQNKRLELGVNCPFHSGGKEICIVAGTNERSRIHEGDPYADAILFIRFKLLKGNKFFHPKL
jgi:hypothetical protein